MFKNFSKKIRKLLKHKGFKNLVIPHKGNNFKPHILHHKRLAFHAGSIIVTKAIVVVFVFLFPVSAWMTPDLLLEESNKVVELTNEVRLNLNLKPLESSQQLSKIALDKAQDMINKQYFAHVGPDNNSLSGWLGQNNYHYIVAGENLAVGFSDAKNLVNAWKASPKHYKNLINPDFSEIGVGLVAGDYKNKPTTFTAQFFAAPRQVMAATELPDSENIDPVLNSAPKPSVLDQYLFLKSKTLKVSGSIFNISSIYFVLLLIIAILALSVNIFIEIKRQHHHVILSTAGLICLLVLFIII